MQLGQETQREEAQGEMMVQAPPKAALEVIEPEFLFQLPVALFDGPALVRQAH
jgi:hypothetical protein